MGKITEEMNMEKEYKPYELELELTENLKDKTDEFIEAMDELVSNLVKSHFSYGEIENTMAELESFRQWSCGFDKWIEELLKDLKYKVKANNADVDLKMVNITIINRDDIFILDSENKDSFLMSCDFLRNDSISSLSDAAIHLYVYFLSYCSKTKNHSFYIHDLDISLLRDQEMPDNEIYKCLLELKDQELIKIYLRNKKNLVQEIQETFNIG